MKTMEIVVGSTANKLPWDKFSPSAPQEVQETMHPPVSMQMEAGLDMGMFLKQNPKQNLKAKPTSKFLSPQTFILSPNMVLKSKPGYVDEEVPPFSVHLKP